MKAKTGATVNRLNHANDALTEKLTRRDFEIDRLAGEIEARNATIAQLNETIEKAGHRFAEEQRMRLAAEAGRDETLKEFGDLKERLARAIENHARLTGYIDRVRENDAPRVSAGDAGEREIDFDRGKDWGTGPAINALRGVPPRHWTSFGQR